MTRTSVSGSDSQEASRSHSITPRLRTLPASREAIGASREAIGASREAMFLHLHSTDIVLNNRV